MTAPIDLSVNAPLPVVGETVLVEASRRAALKLHALPSGGLYHQNGTLDARGTIARWLADSGVKVERDAFILCNGAQQAIHLAFADLAVRSRAIASEAETFSGAIKAAADLGLGWTPVAHDDEGMLPGELDRVLRETGCRVVFTTPVCQNPLGLEAGEARRRAIVELCRKHDAWIVEDDIYAIYASRERVTYRELAPERTYYLTSLSKCLTPLVRVGVLAPPPRRAEHLLRAMRAQSFGIAPSTLELGCALIDLGVHRDAKTALREEAGIRTKLAGEMLGLERIPMPHGSPHIWLPVPDPAAFGARAATAGVLVTPPNSTSIREDGASDGVRLCLLAPENRADAVRALSTLASLMPAER